MQCSAARLHCIDSYSIILYILTCKMQDQHTYIYCSAEKPTHREGGRGTKVRLATYIGCQGTHFSGKGRRAPLVGARVWLLSAVEGVDVQLEVIQLCGWEGEGSRSFVGYKRHTLSYSYYTQRERERERERED